jgi:hypothetical protein
MLIIIPSILLFHYFRKYFGGPSSCDGAIYYVCKGSVNIRNKAETDEYSIAFQDYNTLLSDRTMEMLDTTLFKKFRNNEEDLQRFLETSFIKNEHYSVQMIYYHDCVHIADFNDVKFHHARIYKNLRLLKDTLIKSSEIRIIKTDSLTILEFPPIKF